MKAIASDYNRKGEFAFEKENGFCYRDFVGKPFGGAFAGSVAIHAAHAAGLVLQISCAVITGAHGIDCGVLLLRRLCGDRFVEYGLLAACYCGCAGVCSGKRA